MLRLAMLGWTQKEIGELLGVAQRTVSDDLSRNCETAKNAIRDLASQHIERHEIARRFNLPPVLVEAITLEGLDDAERDYTPAPERRGGLGAARGYWGLLGTTTKEQVSSSEHLNGSIVCPPGANADCRGYFVAGSSFIRVAKCFATPLLRLGSLGHAPPRPLPVVSNRSTSNANIPTVVDGGVRIVSTHITNSHRFLFCLPAGDHGTVYPHQCRYLSLRQP